MRRLGIVFLVFLFLTTLSLTTPALAEVVIELSTEKSTGERALRDVEESTSGGFFPQTDDKGIITERFWLMPWVIDDSAPDGDTTLFSVRNDNFFGTDASVEVEYFDARFNVVAGDILELSANELVPVSVRLVDGLVTAPGDINRGLIQIGSVDDISIDFFDVDFGENFASGDRPINLEAFCSSWRVRFLRFPGTTGGTVLTLLINGPLGSADAAPPTITGDVYTQSGLFLNSFEVRTDEWLVELNALDLVLPGNDFGTIDLEVSTLFTPAAVTFERHSAFAKFSLGVRGVCDDVPVP